MNRSSIFALLIIAAIAALLYFGTKSSDANNKSAVASPTASTTNTTTANTTMKTTKVTIKTEKGDINLDLYPDVAPKTVANFVGLAQKNYYNGITFHRVVDNFVIQAGDPTGTGSGGESIYGKSFEDEINPWSLGLSDDTIKSLQDKGYVFNKNLTSIKIQVGTVAMANAGPNTNGSQFFIVTTEDQSALDGQYTAFGKVISGMDTVLKIKQGDKITSVTIQ